MKFRAAPVSFSSGTLNSFCLSVEAGCEAFKPGFSMVFRQSYSISDFGHGSFRGALFPRKFQLRLEPELKGADEAAV